ncbi:MAG: diacylglycerol kinase [Thermodesulfobacteriota bacterium]
MKYKNGSGWNRLRSAFGWSLAGLASAFHNEVAFRQELVMAAVLLPTGLWLGKGGAEKAMLCSSVFLVLLAELLNSAIESVVDRVGTEKHPLSGRAKDIGSAAVLLALFNLGMVWALVLLWR